MLGWIITENIIDNKPPKTVTDEMIKDYPHVFRLLDDDRVLYFVGRAKLEDDDSPLESAMSSYGCTIMQQFDKTTDDWIDVFNY